MKVDPFNTVKILHTQSLIVRGQTEMLMLDVGIDQMKMLLDKYKNQFLDSKGK